MAHVNLSRAKETSTTIGTASYVLLGTVAGFQSFAAVGNNNTVYYYAEDDVNWEEGVGTYSTTGPTLARTTILSSSNAGAAVNWGVGTREVFCSPPANRFYFQPDGSVELPLVNTPVTPAADKLVFFAGKKASRMLPRFVGPSGLDCTLQPLLSSNKVGRWNPAGNSTTVPAVDGFAAVTAIGTATARNVASTNMATRSRRFGYASTATAGTLCGHYSVVAQLTIGALTALGGFFVVNRFVISDPAAVAGARMFVGLRNAVAVPTNIEPSSGQTNMVGVAKISTSTNLHIVYGGSAAQAPIDLGVNFPANTLSTDLFELALFAPPDTQVIHYQVTRVNTGDTANGTLSGAVGTVIPAASTFLGFAAWRCNNATALAVGLDVVNTYIETDN